MIEKLRVMLRKRIEIYANAYNPNYSLQNWFYYWLHFQNFSYAKDYSPKNCYYEFGTAAGGTLLSFIAASQRFSKDYDFDIKKIKIVLFDSFQGLPEIKVKEDDHYEWSKGAFAYSRDYIEKLIVKHNFPLENVTFVEGFYEDTLNEATFQKIKNNPPSIVTLDVDYYSSTKIALDFLAPLLRSGTPFYFDDIYSFFLHPQLGQLKAISDFSSQGKGQLCLLPDKNYFGKCYMYSRHEWENLSKANP
jgi:hypothetical protein